LRGDQLATPSRPGLKRLESENDVLEQLSTHNRPAPTSVPSYTAPTSEGRNGNNGSDDRDPDLYAYEIPLDLKNKQRWQDKHNPVLYIRAKYLPYRALRQQFWRAMLKQYDADESGKIDKVELITMLDTLGSTLHNSTIDGFFARWKEENERRGFGEDAGRVITMDQAVICLEEQLNKSRETQSQMHRPHWDRSESARTGYTGSGSLTPGWLNSSPDESPGGTTPYLAPMDDVKDRGPNNGMSNLNPNSESIPALEVSDMSEKGETTPSRSSTLDSRPQGPEQTPSAPNLVLTRQESWGQDSETDLLDDRDDPKEEHVVEIQECPICHMPRLNARGGRGKSGRRRRATTDADIITHIATCASSDWRAVNNLVMAGFVTSSQAQRKWYVSWADIDLCYVRPFTLTWIVTGTPRSFPRSLTEDTGSEQIVQTFLSKIALRYASHISCEKRGHANARSQGMINEERMSVYVRLGIRLLYKGLKSNNMEGRRSTLSLNDDQKRSPPTLSRRTSAVAEMRRVVNSVSRLSTSAAHSVTSGWSLPFLSSSMFDVFLLELIIVLTRYRCSPQTSPIDVFQARQEV
jgi:phosphatidylserine decarboxylase